MAKMSFAEYLQARAEYNDYLKGQQDPEKDPKPEDPKPEEDPKPAEDLKPKDGPVGPAEDYRAELNEIREQMKKMAAALSPSLGDVQPVGIEDVVTNFFKQS